MWTCPCRRNVLQLCGILDVASVALALGSVKTMKKTIVKIKVLPGGKMPERKTAGAAAYDCYARESKYVDGVTLIGLGFAMELPEGYYALIVPRSSTGTKTPMRMANSIGIIDSDFRAEVNAIYEVPRTGGYGVSAGDRIAQMIIRKCEDVELVQVDELSETERGAKGFGSTGK